MSRMKELLDQRLEENKHEMWELLKKIYLDIELQNVRGGSDELNIQVDHLLYKIEKKEITNVG